MLGDTVKFARAAGLSEGAILRRHVLKLISIPIVTVFGLEFGSTLAFAVVTETIFSWPGVGKLIIDAINSLDRPVMVAYGPRRGCSSRSTWRSTSSMRSSTRACGRERKHDRPRRRESRLGSRERGPDPRHRSAAAAPVMARRAASPLRAAWGEFKETGSR